MLIVIADDGGYWIPAFAGMTNERRFGVCHLRHKARLAALVDGDDIELSRVPCGCPPGTEGTDACNFGRLCGRLRADGNDVGEILIAEGLAEPYTCWGTSCPQRRDWCQG